MQQFTVPQFIDVEPKIIGPITARQFIIFLVSAFMIFILYKSLDFTGFVLSSVFVFAFAGTFAFLKINGRPFHYFVLNLIQSFKRPGIRIWDHKGETLENKEEKEVKYEKTLTQEKYLNQKRLAKVSLMVDTKGRYKGDDSDLISDEENQEIDF